MAALWRKSKQAKSKGKVKSRTKTAEPATPSSQEQSSQNGVTPDQTAARRLEAAHNKQYSKSKLVRQKNLLRDREFEISYKQILQAVEQGKKWAIVELGAYAEYLRDYMRAIQQYEKLAVQGDLYYMRRIAVIYEQSLEDINSSIDWYTEAGHYGDIYSMIRAANLLELYFEDYEEAVGWYRKAAQCNNLPAIYHLCRIYQHNLQDFDIAIEWYKYAIQLGDIKAAIALGQLYENDLQDYPKAVEWYSFAASHKSLYAVNLLCQLYEVKLHDYPRAIEWYKQAIALYNSKNGKDVVAVDQQAQQSVHAAQMVYNNANGESNSQSNRMRSPAGNSPTNEIDDAVLPNPEDLTPAEIASASPQLHNEAEIEYLG